SGIPQEVPAFTVNMACGSGSKAVQVAAEQVVLGNVEVAVAGGMENMSRTPYLLDRMRTGFRMGAAEVVDGMYRDGFLDPLSGCASGITDGAAAMVLMSESRARAEGRTPLAKLVAFASAGVDPAYMGIGVVPATRKVLEKTGLSLQDFDVIEVNEAFAAQVLA